MCSVCYLGWGGLEGQGQRRSCCPLVAIPETTLRVRVTGEKSLLCVVKRVNLGNLERCFNWIYLEMLLGQLVDSWWSPSSLCYGRRSRTQSLGWRVTSSLTGVASHSAGPLSLCADRFHRFHPASAVCPGLSSTLHTPMLTQFLSQEPWAYCPKSPELLFIKSPSEVHFLWVLYVFVCFLLRS